MKYAYFLFLLLLTFQSHAQLMGFKIPEGKDKIEIPFEYRNNFILVKVILENVFPLNFIFDTGSENTILVKKEFSDLLNITYERKFRIVGADFKTELTAYLARGVSLDMPNMAGTNLDFLVLEDDYFRFEEYTGLKIHGILGMDLFKIFTIKIDYKNKILTLYRVDNFKPSSKKFIPVDIEVFRNKPYLTVDAKLNNDTTTRIKLLLDTGASLALLLHNGSTEAITLPEKLVPGKIGNGLGGFIEGYIGRLHRLSFDKFYFNNVITNFQELKATPDALINFNRNGILGNEILSRFTVIFDLSHSKIYFKPIKKYNKGFKFDKSGLTIIASGKALNEFIVKDLIPISPATEAGVQKGDIIKNINFTPASFYDLRQITKILQKKSGKRIRLIIERNGLRKKIIFRLRDLI